MEYSNSKYGQIENFERYREIRPTKKEFDKVITLEDFGLTGIDLVKLELDQYKHTEELRLAREKWERTDTFILVSSLTFTIVLFALMLTGVIDINYISKPTIIIGGITFIAAGLGVVIKSEQGAKDKPFERSGEWSRYCQYQKALSDAKIECENHYKEALDIYNNWQRLKKEDTWREMDGIQFENKIAELFRANGFRASLTKHGADGGIDIILEKDGIKTAVQCKAHKSKISESVVRDLYGVMHSKGYDRGMLVTLNGGSSNTVAFCKAQKDKPILIMDVHDIVKMQNRTK